MGGMSVRWNPYTYAGGNPVNFVDTNGKFFFFPILVAATAGALIVGGVDLLMQLSANGGRLECINKEQLGMAMRQGFVMGAIAAALSAATGGMGLTGLAAKIPAILVDFTAGYVWNRVVHLRNHDEAFANDVTKIAFGMVVDAASKALMNAIGKGAKWLTKRASQLFGSGNYGDQVAEAAGRTGNVCPANSFSGDTLVAIADGFVPIREIKVGDEVLAYNELTDETGEYTIAHTNSNIVEVQLLPPFAYLQAKHTVVKKS
jgi:hypothetical protein